MDDWMTKHYDLHDDVTFWTYDDFGAWVACLGQAFYYSDMTVIIHRGSHDTAEMIKRVNPKYIRLHGRSFEVVHHAVGKDGYPRIIIEVGYRDLFGEYGELIYGSPDPERQLTLSETEELLRREENQ